MGILDKTIELEDGFTPGGEQLYSFEFTMMQIAFIKAALRLSGLEYQNNREIYKMLCEAGYDEEEKQLLARYE